MCNVLNEDTMTYGVSKVLSKDSSVQIMHSKQQQSVHRQQQQQNTRKVGVMGSRRIFPPSFKLKVLHSYRNDMDCRGNQRATARKYGIHRRQIQKWLQCEESLKNCAENGNARPASTSTTDSSASVSKSDSATEATGLTGSVPAVAISAAPALNLNVARLHGDELTTQQKTPPPSPTHLPRCSTALSPTPCSRTSVPKSMPVPSIVPVKYSQYSLSSERAHLKKIDMDDTRMHAQEIHYVDTQADQEYNYYRDRTSANIVETTQSVHSDDRSESVIEELRKLRNIYYWSPMERQRAASDIEAHPQAFPPHHHSPNHHPQSFGPVTDFYNGHLYGLIGAPLIKAEPASPDSAATSGPYEPAGSPGSQWAPQSPTMPHQVNNNCSGSSLSVHFNSVAGPSYLDTHVHQPVHTHTMVSNVPYDEASSSLHQHERESEKMGYAKEEEKQQERMEQCETIIKEEVNLPEDEVYDERQENNASPYIDVTGDPSMGVNDLDLQSTDVAIEREDSTPSPSDPANSGRSSSTSSYNEMESIDCAPDNQVPSANSTRRQQIRRSFPLKFKVNVLDAYRGRDADVAGNQRATARKYRINRRQVQKWLMQETSFREAIELQTDNSRQQLAPAAPIQEDSAESPIDLTMSHYVSSDQSRPSSGTGFEVDYEQSPPHIDYYEQLTSYQRPYYRFTTETEPTEPCVLPFYADKRTATSTTSSSQDPSLQSSYGSTGSPTLYSPRDYNLDTLNLPSSHTSTRHASSDNTLSPQIYRQDDTASENVTSRNKNPYRVKPKKAWLMAAQVEAALARSSRLRTSPQASSSRSSSRSAKDGILFKPYLDNPVCRPAKKLVSQHNLSLNTRENTINNNRSMESEIDDNDVISDRLHYTTNNEDRSNGFQHNAQTSSTFGNLQSSYADPQQFDTFIRYPLNSRYPPNNSATSNAYSLNSVRPQFPYETQTTGRHGLANMVISHQNCPVGYVIQTPTHRLIITPNDSITRITV